MKPSEPPQRILIIGPPASGKTTLAKLIAPATGPNFRSEVKLAATRLAEADE